MDQKNTIVKCSKHKCLFNNCGTCDQYVITIDVDGKCKCYVETATEEDMQNGVIGEYKTINATCGDCEYFGNIDNCPVYKRTHVAFGMDPICLDFKAKRGQRAKGNFYDNACDVSFLKEDLEKIQQTLEQDSISCTMKVAELNKTNKNKSTIKNVVPECDLPVCDWFCKHALRDGPSFNPYIWCNLYKMNPAMGLFCSLKEEEKNEV